MNSAEIWRVALYSWAFLLLFTAGELLYHALKLPVEITRKFAHVGTGLICLSFPLYLDTHWAVLILSTSFCVLLIVSMRLNLLKSINAVNRKTGGSFMFPIAIYLCFWAYAYLGLGLSSGTDLLEAGSQERKQLAMKVFYFLPILILTLADPAAALVGKQFRWGKYKIFGGTKTLIGSAAFFLVALLVSCVFLMGASAEAGELLLLAVLLALVTTLAEALSQKGLDNLLVPASALAVLWLFQHFLKI